MAQTISQKSAEEFVEKWSKVELSERAASHEHFIDLCRLIDEPTPASADATGEEYTFEKPVKVTLSASKGSKVVMLPLRRKWDALREELKDALARHDAEPDRKKRDLLSAPLRIRFDQFRRHLGAQRILDPACGSGNFLYVALRQLLDLDDEVVRFAALRDVALSPIPYVRPVHGTHAQLMGIEINRYAAEIAQVVIWIGYLQWLSIRGIDPPHNPILNKLDCIDNRDAILDLTDKNNPTAAKWPEADFIIGNPPFLGSKLFRMHGLSDAYLNALWKAFDLPRSSDLCCYWFELAGRRVARDGATRAGLLATQGIRGGDNRTVLEHIKDKGDIFLAWSDKNWVLDGATVHVSIVGFDAGTEMVHELDAAWAYYKRKPDEIDALIDAQEHEDG